MTDEVQAEAEQSGPQVSGFEAPIQALVDNVILAAKDADICLKEGNKSAGRRARKLLGDVKKGITPLRITILEKMKTKE